MMLHPCFDVKPTRYASRKLWLGKYFQRQLASRAHVLGLMHVADAAVAGIPVTSKDPIRLPEGIGTNHFPFQLRIKVMGLFDVGAIAWFTRNRPSRKTA